MGQRIQNCEWFLREADMIYLIRHGKDDDTIRGGWSNHGLTNEGVKQTENLADKLFAEGVRFDCIYSSDLARAKQTSEILANLLKAPIFLSEAFREVNNGVLAGMKNEEVKEKYPGLFWSFLAYDECYPDGESPKQFFERIKKAWTDLKKEVAENKYNSVALVTHGGVIEAIMCIENCVEFSNKEQNFRVGNAEYVQLI